MTEGVRDELPGDDVAQFLTERFKQPEQRLAEALDRLTQATYDHTVVTALLARGELDEALNLAVASGTGNVERARRLRVAAGDHVRPSLRDLD